MPWFISFYRATRNKKTKMLFMTNECISYMPTKEKADGLTR